jgi:acylphosphatase
MQMSNMKKAHFIVEGRVQGVSFRWFVRDSAIQLGLTGTVKNLSDGSVDVYVEGAESRILDLVQIMRKGNGISRVDGIHEKWEDSTQEWQTFTILF